MFLGIDPSLTGTGIILLDKDGRIIEERLIKSKSRGKEVIPELERMLDIIDDIFNCAMFFSDIDIVCIEGLAFMARNTSALVQLGYLNYKIREKLYNRDIKFYIIAPTSLKKYACGKGNAKKDLVLLDVYKRWNVSFDDDNLADAFVLAKIASALNNEPADITQKQLEVLKKIKQLT